MKTWIWLWGWDGKSRYDQSQRHVPYPKEGYIRTTMCDAQLFTQLCIVADFSVVCHTVCYYTQILTLACARHGLVFCAYNSQN